MKDEKMSGYAKAYPKKYKYMLEFFSCLVFSIGVIIFSRENFFNPSYVFGEVLGFALPLSLIAILILRNLKFIKHYLKAPALFFFLFSVFFLAKVAFLSVSYSDRVYFLESFRSILHKQPLPKPKKKSNREYYKVFKAMEKYKKKLDSLSLEMADSMKDFRGVLSPEVIANSDGPPIEVEKAQGILSLYRKALNDYYVHFPEKVNQANLNKQFVTSFDKSWRVEGGKNYQLRVRYIKILSEIFSDINKIYSVCQADMVMYDPEKNKLIFNDAHHLQQYNALILQVRELLVRARHELDQMTGKIQNKDKKMIDSWLG